MAATSQPIACHSSNSPDIHIPLSTHSTQFPSSYFLGSPLSWRAGSFGSRFYPGCSPGQLLGPLDPSDFKCAKLSSSLESDRGSILNAISTFDREDELCRNYSCCGLQIDDLHALVQHFEEVHVVVVDQFARQPVRPQPLPYALDPNQHLPPPYHHGGFDPDDMELDVDQSSSPSSGGPTPPDTPLTTPLSSHPTHSFNHFGQSAKDPSPPSPVSAVRHNDSSDALHPRSLNRCLSLVPEQRA
ncbi:hypothetical protein J3R83DRAFT_9356 [Lanmaoa asiatica]|nr:hypothetical protein J3R83DRAFT_9356 [Lanmaoa asiatica]